MSGQPLYTEEQFFKAIDGSGGLKTTIAARIGCSWNTVDKYIKEYPAILQAYEDECEKVNDLAQSKIMEAIRDGDIPVCRWWLAKKRKKEFGDALDLTSDNTPITFNVVYEDEKAHEEE